MTINHPLFNLAYEVTAGASLGFLAGSVAAYVIVSVACLLGC